MTSTDSQSFLSTIHNTRYLERSTRPRHAEREERLAHWGVGALLTLLTLLAGWRFSSREIGNSTSRSAVLEFGCLVMLMNLISPVCHFHYFAMSVPVAMGVLAASRTETTFMPGRIRLLFCIVFACGILPVLPGLEVLRDLGLAMYAQLLLWSTGMIMLCRQGDVRESAWKLQKAA